MSKEEIKERIRENFQNSPWLKNLENQRNHIYPTLKIQDFEKTEHTEQPLRESKGKKLVDIRYINNEIDEELPVDKIETEDVYLKVISNKK